MGTFVGLFQAKDSKISEEKRAEFEQHIEKLFQAGGMMEIVPVRLCGKEITTLRKASMHEDGMEFNYNYFEEDVWEEAGFNRKRCSVWSGEVGHGIFKRVITSACFLQGLRTEGLTVTQVNGQFVSARRYIGWINYLFQEQNYFCNLDLWGLFEAMHADEWESRFLVEKDWTMLMYTLRGVIDFLAVKAVTGGVDASLKELDAFIKQGWAMDIYSSTIKTLKSQVAEFRQNNTFEETRQLEIIVNMLHSLWESKDFDAELNKKYPKGLYQVLASSYILRMPAIVIQIIAEEYKRDFWELWKSVRDVAKEVCDYWQGGEVDEIAPVTTEDFLGVAEGNLILYWEKDGNITFSEELEAWFQSLKQNYNQCLESLVPVEQPLLWILDLMEYAQNNYGFIFTIADFFEETIVHLNDVRYLALWKLYEGMLYDEEMKKAGSVIFRPAEEEGDSDGKGANRLLITSWTFIGKSKKENKARVLLRQYMALVANKELRKEVFGF